MSKPKLITLAVLGILVLILIVQNSQAVKVHLFFWQRDISLIILLASSLILGGVFGLLLATKGKKKPAPSPAAEPEDTPEDKPEA